MVAVALHEEHGEVVATWRRLGYRHETVVCFDRHLDLKPLAAEAAAEIAGARSADALAALNRPLPVREIAGAYGLDDFFAAGPVLGTVDRLIWVVPGDVGDGPDARRRLLRTVSLLPCDGAAATGGPRFVGRRLHITVCGLSLEVCDARALRAGGIPPDARIDVDLDWFADEDRPAQHRPEEFVGLVDDLADRGRVDSATYSIRSGFLAERYRYLGTTIASQLGRTAATVERRDARALPERTFAALRDGAGVTPDVARGCHAELEPLGATGTVLGGLLSLPAAPDAAAAAWHDAAAAGVRSVWLAYRLGLWHQQGRRYAEALPWLTAAAAHRHDTAAVHAAVLRTVCLLRLDRPAQALAGARDLAAAHPLRQDVVQIGALAAAACGDTTARDAFTRHATWLDHLIAGGVAP